MPTSLTPDGVLTARCGRSGAPTRRCPIDAQVRFDRFQSALGFRAELGSSAPVVELTALDGEPIVPTVHLHVDPATLAEHVGDDHDVPDEDPEQREDREAARLQSVLALIEEAILGRGPGQDHLLLVEGGVRAVRADAVGADAVDARAPSR